MFCNRCKEEKSTDDFYKQKNEAGETVCAAPCKECRKALAKEYRRKNPKPKKPKKPRMQGFRKLPEDKRKCCTCEGIKSIDDFYKDKQRASGVSSRCKECQNLYLKERRKEKGVEILEVRRSWRKANTERLRKQDALYKQNNRERLRVNEANRRARKRMLPDTLTEIEAFEILETFNGKCAFCDAEAEHLDHFIPLVTECGGTIKENIIPLCQPMNSSKHGRNPFLWADIYLKGEEKRKFEQTVRYLADLNNMTTTDYKQYVFMCFKNTIASIQAHS